MAYTSGVKGLCTVPGAALGSANIDPVGLVRRWDAEISAELHDATTFENQTNHPETIRGLYDVKGTCEAIFDGANKLDFTNLQTIDQGPTAAFALYLIASTHGYTFAGIISIADITVERRGQALVVLSFESSGAITTV